MQDGQHGVEFLPVQATVVHHVGLVVPGGDGGLLEHRAHGAAVVGAVAQEARQQGGVAGHEAAAHAGHVGALGQAGEDHHAPIVGAAQLPAYRQGTQGRGGFVVVDLGIALVGGDDEAVPVGQRKQGAPFVQVHDGTGGVTGRADVDELHLRPQAVGHLGPVHPEAVVGALVQQVQAGAGQQRGAFIDLIEGVGRDDDLGARGRRVEHGLREGEQGLARAVDGQHLGGGIDGGVVAAPDPGSDGLAQGRGAGGGRVAGQTVSGSGQGVQHHGRGGVARLTDGEIHQRQAGRLQACGLGSQQRTQALERIGLQEVETGVGGQAHAGGVSFQARDADYKEREFVAE